MAPLSLHLRQVRPVITTGCHPPQCECIALPLPCYCAAANSKQSALTIDGCLGVHQLLVISLGFAFSHNGSDSALDCAVAHTGVANHDAIAAAKGAVAGLTIGASATYAPHNIRINCIAPGLVSMSMHEQTRQGDEVVETCLPVQMHAVCLYI